MTATSSRRKAAQRWGTLARTGSGACVGVPTYMAKGAGTIVPAGSARAEETEEGQCPH